MQERLQRFPIKSACSQKLKVLLNCNFSLIYTKSQLGRLMRIIWIHIKSEGIIKSLASFYGDIREKSIQEEK